MEQVKHPSPCVRKVTPPIQYNRLTLFLGRTTLQALPYGQVTSQPNPRQAGPVQHTATDPRPAAAPSSRNPARAPFRSRFKKRTTPHHHYKAAAAAAMPSAPGADPQATAQLLAQLPYAPSESQSLSSHSLRGGGTSLSPLRLRTSATILPARVEGSMGSWTMVSQWSKTSWGKA